MFSSSMLYGLQGMPFASGIVNGYKFFLDVLGYNQKVAQQKSYDAQIAYEQYLKAGYERAYRDWQFNVPNRSIRYPELSYPGQIYRSDTAITRANLGSDIAKSNFYGSLPYRTAGLYGISSRLSRSL